MVNDFAAEGRELLEGAEAALLCLETNPDDAEAINTVFRAFHTIKGMAGFLGLDVVAAIAHKAESLLSRMRDREIRCSGRHAELALRSVDCLKTLIDEVVAPGDGGAADPQALLDALDHVDAE
ncbi:MAG: Hpt domain-containing protein, partial [Gemmatimonadota bacterium]|nr:Hpt domain-containing protein [Gemmatimonadota bacterium]